MKRYLLILVLVLFAIACESRTTVGPKPYGVNVSMVLKDSDGKPILCASDSDCDGLVAKDKCIYGTACINKQCEELIVGSCCETDGKDIICPAFVACGNDEECDDNNQCTDDVCNTYLFDGVCTHSPINLGATYCGVGACANSAPTCKNGELNTEQCQPLAPLSESCNQLDDDCDGTTDEGANACNGVCELAHQPGAACDGVDTDLCVDDAYACTGLNAVACSVGADNAESCNQLDDDCDGTIDEGANACNGVCVLAHQPGAACDSASDLDLCPDDVYACDGSNDVTCVWGGDEDAESCNQLDDDCDGVTDEEGAVGCTIYYYDGDADGFGVAENTKCFCAPTGNYTAIVADDCDDSNNIVYPGATELCNNNDDNCDEDIDEVFSVGGDCDGADADLCEHGTYTCKPDGSGVECLNEAPVNIVEICDNKDNDCDGAVDEGNPGGGADCGQSDVGECQLGELVCVKGAVICAGAMNPSEEICDGLDNDCDGVTNEDDVCSTCNNPTGEIACNGGPFAGAMGDENSLDEYSCKPLLNESGSEAVFTFNSNLGGLEVTVLPINLDPATADLDVFILDSCAASDCLEYGNKSATWNSEIGTDYFVVVDGYKGAKADFDLQVICKETACGDGLDNDADGKKDCADSDCKFVTVCLPTCQPLDDIVCNESKVGTTVGAANFMSGYDCTPFDESGPEAVYEFTAPFTGSATVSVSSSTDLDPVVLKGICQANQCVAFGNSSATFQMVKEEVFYLVADGYNGNQGDYSLSLTCKQ